MFKTNLLYKAGSSNKHYYKKHKKKKPKKIKSMNKTSIRYKRHQERKSSPLIWDEQRKACYKKSGVKCCECGKKNIMLVAHHDTYKYEFGSQEEQACLSSLCVECHNVFHKIHKYDDKLQTYLKV